MRANPRPNRLGRVKRDAASEFVDDQGFVISFIEPEYMMPSHHHWRVERMYAEKRAKLNGGGGRSAVTHQSHACRWILLGLLSNCHPAVVTKTS